MIKTTLEFLTTNGYHRDMERTLREVSGKPGSLADCAANQIQHLKTLLNRVVQDKLDGRLEAEIKEALAR